MEEGEEELEGFLRAKRSINDTVKKSTDTSTSINNGQMTRRHLRGFILQIRVVIH